VKIRTTGVVGIIVVLHFVIVGSVAMQGCGRTVAPVAAERIGTGSMPPTEPQLTPPVFRPSAVRPVDRMIVASDLKTYTVKRGDCLSRIASRHGIKVKEILELNSLRDKNVVFIGQTLNLPAHAQVRAPDRSAPRAPAPAPTITSAQESGKYVVQSGDCLSKIAAKYRTTTKELMAMNGLSRDLIRVGQKLTVPNGSESSGGLPAPVGVGEMQKKPEFGLEDTFDDDVVDDGSTFSDQDDELFILHTVEIGEDIEEVASKFGVSADRLMSINGMSSRKLKPGMDLKIPQGN
jgi:LysM repeat protein